MFENDIVSVLVSVYGYWWYIVIEKLEHISVYLEKYSLKFQSTKVYDIYSAMWLFHRTGILREKHFLSKLLPPILQWNPVMSGCCTDSCPVHSAVLYNTTGIIFSFYLSQYDTKKKWIFCAGYLCFLGPGPGPGPGPQPHFVFDGPLPNLYLVAPALSLCLPAMAD